MDDLGKWLQRKLHEKRKARMARLKQPPKVHIPPLPESLLAYLTSWCHWPHEDTLEPVASLNPVQSDYHSRRTAFRRRAGGRMFGADVVGKSRRARMTSYGLGAIQYEIMREAETGGFLRALTTLQAGTDDILEPLLEQMEFSLGELPEPYRSRWDSKGYSWRYMKRASWHLTTAGNAATVAGRKGRAARWDILHMSDAGTYPHAEALWNAAWPTIPKQTGSVLVESTFPRDPEHWFWRRWLAAREKRDPVFLRAFFWPWHADPSRRIDQEHPSFAAAMSIDVDEVERAKEDALGLDIEQIAFRRQNRCGGTLPERRAARREYPEAPEEAMQVLGEQWLDEEALQRCEARVREPLFRVRLGDALSVSIWDLDPGAVVLGLDRASREGRDYSAVVGLHPRTLEQVCEVHGRCTAAELDHGIALVLWQLGLLGTKRYTIAPERNRAKDIIGELSRPKPDGVRLRLREPKRGAWRSAEGVVELRWDHRKRLWRPPVAGENRSRERGAIGFITTGNSRPMILDKLVVAVEGDSPVRLFSSYLVAELRSFHVTEKNRPEGNPHDDLSFALGMALLCAPTVKMGPTIDDFEEFWGRSRVMQRPSASLPV